MIIGEAKIRRLTGSTLTSSAGLSDAQKSCQGAHGIEGIDSLEFLNQASQTGGKWTQVSEFVCIFTHNMLAPIRATEQVLKRLDSAGRMTFDIWNAGTLMTRKNGSLFVYILDATRPCFTRSVNEVSFLRVCPP